MRDYKKIEAILANYDASDEKIVNDTIDELCKKGIAKGVYQDYAVLADVITFLGEFVRLVKEAGEDEQRV